MAWTWQLENAEGVVLDEPAVPAQGNQSDAESWLGETWLELRESGVAQVTLLDSGTKVYGPMSLADE